MWIDLFANRVVTAKFRIIKIINRMCLGSSMTLEDLYRLLRAGHVQAQGVVDTISAPLVVLDGALNVVSANPAFLAAFQVSREDAIGHEFFEAGHGRWKDPKLEELLRKVIPNTAAVIGYEIKLEGIDRAPRTMLITARRLSHPDNNSQMLLMVFEDVTDQRAKSAKQDVVAAEIKHRFKNFLALVASLARQSTTDGMSAAEYRDTLLGRIEALAEAELALFGEDQTTVRTVLNRVTLPYGDRVEIQSCPEIEIGPQASSSLNMVLHELATNAAKHGALSVQGGKVIVSAFLEGNKLHIQWSEEGGPQVHRKAPDGFGSKLITLLVEEQLRGEVKLNYRDNGLAASIAFPVKTD